MDTLHEALLTVNARFYRALSLADFTAMKQVWLDSGQAVCAHPGGQPLQGWAAIAESWEAIFKNQGPLHVWPSDIQVRVYGQTAEINCLENIDAAKVPGGGIAQARATNIFRQVAGQWKMLEHHAESLPAVSGLRVPERFSPN